MQFYTLTTFTFKIRYLLNRSVCTYSGCNAYWCRSTSRCHLFDISLGLKYICDDIFRSNFFSCRSPLSNAFLYQVERSYYKHGLFLQPIFKLLTLYVFDDVCSKRFPIEIQRSFYYFTTQDSYREMTSSVDTIMSNTWLAKVASELRHKIVQFSVPCFLI